MTRSQIRYALFRCKTGNPEQEHLDVLKRYQPLLKESKLHVHDFSTVWDISTTEPFDSILVGGAVIMLHEKRDESVVHEDGTPKDSMVAAIAKKTKLGR